MKPPQVQEKGFPTRVGFNPSHLPMTKAEIVRSQLTQEYGRIGVEMTRKHPSERYYWIDKNRSASYITAPKVSGSKAFKALLTVFL